MESVTLSIGQVAKQLGVGKHRIIYAHLAGKVAEPSKHSGQRAYNQADIARLSRYFDLNPPTRGGRHEPTEINPPEPISQIQVGKVLQKRLKLQRVVVRAEEAYIIGYSEPNGNDRLFAVPKVRGESKEWHLEQFSKAYSVPVERLGCEELPMVYFYT